jgi:multiple sugar transport system substrate-binding protein
VKSTNLVYWSSNNPDEITLANQVVTEWNRTHPDIVVSHQPIPEGESSEEIILAAVVGKTAPDIYSNMWPGDVESYARADQLIDLDRFTDFQFQVDDRFTPDVLSQCRSRNSHVYQLFWKTNPIMLMFNKKMFKSAGNLFGLSHRR